MYLSLLVLVLIVGLLQVLWKKRRQIALTRLLKNNLKSYPIIGHAWMSIGTDEDRMRAVECAGIDTIKHGGVAAYWLLHIVIVCVSDPVVADIVLKYCLKKHSLVDVFHFLIGNGSIFAPVPIWRPRRKILTHIFTANHLTKFVEVFAQQSNIMTDLMQKEVGNGVFSFWEYIQRYALDAICENNFGTKLGSQVHHEHSLLVAIDEIFEILAQRVSQPWFYNDFMFRFMNGYTAACKHRKTILEFLIKVIEEKRAEIDRNNQMTDKEPENELSKKTTLQAATALRIKILVLVLIVVIAVVCAIYWCNNRSKNIKDSQDAARTLSFLDLHLNRSDNNGRFTKMELIEEATILVLAGSDTNATGAAFTVLMLARYPEIQEKVYQELVEVVGESEDIVTAKDLPQLKYLEAVIKESLRLYPPVPIIIREVEQDVTIPSGVTLVEGCGILVNIWAIHRNPQYWQDADQFRPERFLEPLKHPAAFMPFSYGPRSCIGGQYGMYSMKTLLATMLRKYRILPPPGTDPALPITTKFDIMLKPVQGFQIMLEQRNNSQTSN